MGIPEWEKINMWEEEIIKEIIQKISPTEGHESSDWSESLRIHNNELSERFNQVTFVGNFKISYYKSSQREWQLLY